MYHLKQYGAVSWPSLNLKSERCAVLDGSQTIQNKIPLVCGLRVVLFLDGSQAMLGSRSCSTSFESRDVLGGSQTVGSSPTLATKFESRVVLDGKTTKYGPKAASRNMVGSFCFVIDA